MNFKDLLSFIAPKSKEPPEKLPHPSADVDDHVIIKQEELHASDAYMSLKTNFRDIGRMNAIIETLGRDFLTAMPQGAYKSRLGHIAFLYRRMHEDLTNTSVRKMLDEAQEHQYKQPGEWDEWDTANLREMTKMYLMFCNIPGDVMERKARLSYEGRRHHNQVKANGDWDMAKKFLSAQIDLHREIAEARCEAHDQNSMYQMLMQEYMPEMTIFDVENLFSEHEENLKNIIPKIKKKQVGEPEPLPLTGEYEPEAQMWLNRSMLHVLGFDFKRGGLYETGHNPVEGGTPEDTRLVISNVDEADFMDSLKSALHEGGHGLYIQGLPRKLWRYQPVAMDLGAGVHESQALLIEMIIGRMPEFFEFISPRLEGLFHGMNAPALSPENLFSLKTRLSPCVDRKKADEVTYFYHILLRFRIERDLIEGALKIDDMPEAWVESMNEMLGILPNNHLEGCLQDVHWFVGKFGYFPSYMIGQMLAAQLFYTLEGAIPSLKDDITHGQFTNVRSWLGDNIYSKGRLMGMKQLIKQATGHRLRPDFLEKHIRNRYLN